MIGGILVFWVKHTNTKLIAFGTGLSAGIMIYMSFFELIRESSEKLQLAEVVDSKRIIVFAFITGVVAAFLIDLLTHRIVENSAGLFAEDYCTKHHKALFKTGIFTAVVLALHNIPEGIITFAAAVVDKTFGISVAIAIAIHNIPEGLCISFPVYCSTKSKAKSLLYVFVASLAEPAGAIVMYLFLYKFINDFAIGAMLAGVAGIMTYVAFDELLPMSKKMGHSHIGLSGLICGMILMSLVFNII